MKDLRTANDMVDKFINMSAIERSIPTARSIAEIFRTTSEDSPLRRLAVDLLTFEGQTSAYDSVENRDVLSKRFFELLAKRLGDLTRHENRQRSMSELFSFRISENMCTYHQHNDSVPVCSGL